MLDTGDNIIRNIIKLGLIVEHAKSYACPHKMNAGFSDVLLSNKTLV